MAINLSRSAPLTGGGTVSGDLTVKGDLAVEGDGSITIDTATSGNVSIIDTTTSSATEGGNLILASDDGAVMASGHRLGVLSFAGAEDTSSTLTTGARIEAVTDAIWSASENGANLNFYTTDANASQTQRMTILATGNVGIGTTDPGKRLHVVHDTSTTEYPLMINNTYSTVGARTGVLFKVHDQEASIEVERGAANQGLDMRFLVAHPDTGTKTERLTILESGKVGIGTTSPESLLHVEADSVGGAVLSLSQKSGGPTVADTNIIGEIDFAGWDNSGDDSYRIGGKILAKAQGAWGSSLNNPVKLEFYTEDGNTGSSGLGSPRMVIDKDGNVGIGTTSPDGVLQLSKDSGDCSLFITTYDDDVGEHSRLLFQKSDGTEADPDLIHDNDVLGTIEFEGMDADSSGSFIGGAMIVARIDGTPTDDEMPTDLEFWTNTGASAAVMNAFLAEGGDWYTNDGTTSSIASDERLKKDIRDFTHGLSVVNQLNPVYYKFNGKGGRNEDTEDRVGMLANIVKDIAPDVVKTTVGELDGVDTDLYTMSYDKLIFYAINAIQELSAEVEKLKS